MNEDDLKTIDYLLNIWRMNLLGDDSSLRKLWFAPQVAWSQMAVSNHMASMDDLGENEERVKRLYINAICTCLENIRYSHPHCYWAVDRKMGIGNIWSVRYPRLDIDDAFLQAKELLLPALEAKGIIFSGNLVDGKHKQINMC
jgi:hypothetical protein